MTRSKQELFKKKQQQQQKSAVGQAMETNPLGQLLIFLHHTLYMSFEQIFQSAKKHGNKISASEQKPWRKKNIRNL